MNIKTLLTDNNFYYWHGIKLTPELAPYKANIFKEVCGDNPTKCRRVNEICIVVDTYQVSCGYGSENRLEEVNKVINFKNDYERDRFYENFMMIIDEFKNGRLTRKYPTPICLYDESWEEVYKENIYSQVCWELVKDKLSPP